MHHIVQVNYKVKYVQQDITEDATINKTALKQFRFCKRQHEGMTSLAK